MSLRSGSGDIFRGLAAERLVGALALPVRPYVGLSCLWFRSPLEVDGRSWFIVLCLFLSERGLLQILSRRDVCPSVYNNLEAVLDLVRYCCGWVLVSGFVCSLDLVYWVCELLRGESRCWPQAFVHLGNQIWFGFDYVRIFFFSLGMALPASCLIWVLVM